MLLNLIYVLQCSKLGLELLHDIKLVKIKQIQLRKSKMHDAWSAASCIIDEFTYSYLSLYSTRVLFFFNLISTSSIISVSTGKYGSGWYYKYISACNVGCLSLLKCPQVQYFRCRPGDTGL